MHFIDTHSHLYLPEFVQDIQDVIQRAKSQGIVSVLLPNIDSSSVEPLKELCNQYPGFFYPMMGLHPTSVKENYMEELNVVKQELETGNYIGVGEIGIDLYWDKTFRKEQMTAFALQVQWALELNKPFIIHSREAFPEVFEVLEKEAKGVYCGIFHAFSGSVNEAKRAIDLGFKLGIGGVVTYKNAGLDKTIAKIGFEHLVLETDAPYLSPVPKRGKRNESAYLLYSAQKIADLCGVEIKVIAEKSTQNALEVFGMGIV